ncbi:hypothetical protein [Thermomonospora umbrina]|uniref:Uncharacterized protein n=1 Tax=Thermomonospora umbrina TaxID=111806 RepID=A0A3D9SRZ5_9ACTN|nr:hypothetical protein [Thermomonospora umbrina]REE95735.1 hypothetical protein DFJ69_1144 [Thermomonospora umbrina]
MSTGPIDGSGGGMSAPDRFPSCGGVLVRVSARPFPVARPVEAPAARAAGRTDDGIAGGPFVSSSTVKARPAGVRREPSEIAARAWESGTVR